MQDNTREYFERDLPIYVERSIEYYNTVKDNPLRWDLGYCDLQSSINCAEVDGHISSEEARLLRKKYLGL